MKTRTALVTGASSGIGEVFVKELAKKGYTITCVARSGDKLRALVKELGGGHRFIVDDLFDHYRHMLESQANHRPHSC